MFLLKRIAFVIFIVAALGCATWAYLRLKESKKPKVEAISLLPDSCLVYLSTPDFFELNKRLNSQNLLVDKLKLIKDIDSFCGTLQLVDSLLSDNELLQKEVTDNPVHFALYKDLGWLVSFNIKQLGDQEAIAEQLSSAFHAGRTEGDLYQFRLGANTKLYFTLHDGVGLLSNHPATIELALSRKHPKLYRNREFAQFKSTLEENNPLSVYTDHRLYAQSRIAQKLDLSVLFKKGCSAGAIDIEPSQIAVNGFAACDSTELLSLLNNQEAVAPAEFITQLPLGTSSFTAYGFGDYADMRKAIKRLHPNAQTHAFWKQVNDSALYNLETDFNHNAASCLVSFETRFPQQNFVLLQVNDTALTREHLQFMGDSLLHYQGAEVCHLHRPGALFAPLSRLSASYMALRGNYLFFAESKEALLRLMDALQNKSLMTSNSSFVAYMSQNFPEAFNFLIYSAPNQMQDRLHSFFNFKTNGDTDPYSNFRHFSFCVTNQASQFKFRWHLLNEAETMNKDQNALWTLALDHPVSSKAAVFVNHLTSENELVLQDDGKVLYLLNAKGSIIWKKELSERIESPLFTVDALKNNKYQLLFNTKNYLHLIDRKGNEVKGFPVKLPAEASSPLALLDYDNDKDYRLLIACKNKMIYNYSVSGAMQDGFAPLRTDAEVRLPVQYVEVGQSDYLVTVDTEGKIYTFSRKGAGRIGLTNRTVANCGAFYIDATNNINSTFLVYADDKNNLISKISFSDKKEIVKLNADISNSQITFALVDENRSMDVVFTKANGLAAFDLNGNLLFEKDTGLEAGETDFYSDENRSVFCTLNAAHNELMVIDQQKGNTQSYKASALPLICRLFNDNKKYLVISNGDHINCVPLN